MLRAKSVFNDSISASKKHAILFDYLTAQVRVPVPFDDLLRAQVVMAVAAFDKLLHDLIRIGMCEIYSGRRIPTPRYKSESITIQLHSELSGAVFPPKEYIFEQAIISKLGYLSFQHPEKISDGLSLIWLEKQKWDKIGGLMGCSGHFASTKMKLIANRRNAIVHEADMDPITNAKSQITKAECEDMTDYTARCGNAIADLVI